MIKPVIPRTKPVSTVDRLLALPAVFTLKELRGIGLEGNHLHTFLLRAEEAERIAPVGKRTGAYFNLIVDPKGPTNRRLEAVRKLYPSAVLGGTAVLHAAGWVTQIPQTYDVMVRYRRSIKSIHGVKLLLRPRSWYEAQMQAGNIIHETESDFGIATLTPKAALEDAKEHKDSWVPDDDDLDIDETDLFDAFAMTP
jgi:hypothetical protein